MPNKNGESIPSKSQEYIRYNTYFTADQQKGFVGSLFDNGKFNELKFSGLANDLQKKLLFDTNFTSKISLDNSKIPTYINLLKTHFNDQKDFNKKRSILASLNIKGSKEVIKGIISTVKNGTPEQKKIVRESLEGFFEVGELVNSFAPTYSRDSKDGKKGMTDQTKEVFLNKALATKNQSAQRYSSKSGPQNELIRTYFLDTMFDIVQAETDLKPNKLDDTHKHYLDCFFVERNNLTDSQKSAIISGINAFGANNQNEVDQINKLDKEVFYSFLNLIVASLNKNSKSIADLNASKNGADSLGFVETIVNDFQSTIDLAKKGGIPTNINEIDIFDYIKTSNPEKDIKTKQEDGKVSLYYLQDGQPVDLYNSTNTFQALATQQAILDNRIRETGNIDAVRELDEINKSFYNAYAGLGKVDILEKTRGTERLLQIQQDIENDQTQKTSEFQDFDSFKEIEKTFLENKSLQEFDDLITKEDLKSGLSDEEYQKILTEQNDQKESSKKDTINENYLLNQANEEVKKGFVDRLSYFFINSLDIQIGDSEKENILKNIDLEKTNSKSDQPNEISIKGKINNSELSFSYNIETGYLAVDKFLSINKYQNNIDVGSKISEIKSFRGPSFSDYKDSAKDIGYGSILKKTANELPSESSDLYQKFRENIKKEIDKKSPILEKTQEFENEIKDVLLKNILSQEIFDKMGIKNKSWLNRPIDGNNNSYKHIGLLARSIESYDQQELLLFRDFFEQIEDFYYKVEQTENSENVVEKKLSSLSEDVFPRYKTAKKFLQNIFVKKEKKSHNPDYTGAQFYGFFDSFLSGNERLSFDGKKIIDPSKIKMFLSDLSQEKQTLNSKTGDYFPAFEENLKKATADQDLKRDIKSI